MTRLPTRPFGTTGLQITRVGFGNWALGGGDWAFGWGPQDDSASLATMRHALELGINWIDTAPIYGLGHSEVLVGRLLKEIPKGERPLIFTKCGIVWDAKDRMADAKRTIAPASIRMEIETSLQRLGVEQIDLYQFHWPDSDGLPVEESWQVMIDLQKEGKIRFIGVCNFTPELMEGCEKLKHVDSLQPPFSMIRRGAGGDSIPWAHAHDTGVIVYSPMQAGILNDRFSLERVAQLAEGDWRRRTKEWNPPNVQKNIALRDALKPIAKRYDSNVAAVAVAWTLAWPGVTAAICGARTPEQVDGWIGAASLELTKADLDEITRAIETTGAGSGPKRPA
jgi:aryl-alcohol dehydrogenase-like predicted oxidoreductase